MTTSAGVTPGASVDEERVQRFLEKVITDTGAAVAGLCTSLGDRLGLYTAMAGAGPLTSAQLAARTGLVERYVREWLAAQVAGEYISYAPGTDTYRLPDEHAAVLADPDLPTYAAGFSTLLQAIYATEDTLLEAFRTGEGVGWEEHGPALFAGTAKFFRPGYAASLVPEWLTSLDGVVEKLERGARVADVGCGYGYSTTLMAQAFPRSHFDGFDFHGPSIEAARGLVAEQGLDDRVSFEVATAQDFPGEDFDLITFFDCLHDIGDPGGALHHAEHALADGGTCMVVEPNTSANAQENANPIGRALTAASGAVCLPSALAQHGPQALGNHAGEEAMRQIADEAGLHHWRLAAESPVNRVYAVGR
ncbi:class I SAM-dependent methyltransferase [Streptomyces decoyicus]|uniref:class I SAM-dependent methyltransferase n=1 Tax=Streptomyces decoyicus TaxID=249567 RepID=UPI0004AAB986|nr:class I SAM-dependent methyltransferase [Streptomyces decoyicus]KOG50445.1 SAM-dependent methyltransferase [Streptomyces decoyicus]QZY14972.1 class I SAM-dependent methyltransferase [Streptomyces decoyicus]